MVVCGCSASGGVILLQGLLSVVLLTVKDWTAARVTPISCVLVLMNRVIFIELDLMLCDKLLYL